MSIPRFSVNNTVLVNMMMFTLLLAGTGFALTLVREMFPESRPDQIVISAVYPAVQPQELEKALTIKIEEAVRDIDEIEKVDSSVSEGLSRTTLTLFNEVENVDAVLQEVKNEVDAIEDLPDDLEKITVNKMEPTLPVISVAIYGNGTEAQLKAAARSLEDDLRKLPGVSDIQLGGVRDDEISIEIQPDKLLQYDITLREVADAIRKTNLDVSAGNLKGSRSNTSVRILNEDSQGYELEDLEIRTDSAGRVIRLADVAEIRDEFVDSDVETYFNGKPAVSLIIQKTKSQDAIQIANIVRAYVAGKKGEPYDANGFQAAYDQPWHQKPFALVGTTLGWVTDRVIGRPDPQKIYEESRARPFAHNFEVTMYSDLSRFVQGRLDLMTRNGKMGLILVLISLNLFLNWRVAFWAAIGLPVSFLGTFLVMWLLGSTINLISLLGLIIVLGIVVDDAIVIGENIFRHVEEGMPAREAAIKGAEEVMWPVIVAIGTTIAAFAPLLFIQGRIGDFMRELPIVVVAALSVSLIEAIVILPAHLSHLPKVKKREEQDKDAQKSTGEKRTISSRLAGFRNWQHWLMQDVLANGFERILRVALRWRYVTFSLAVASVIVSAGLYAGGIVKDEFIQKMDSETIIGEIEMPVGTVIDDTRERVRQLSEYVVGLPEVTSVQSNVGSRANIGGSGAMGGEAQSHLGQLIVELKEGDLRERTGLRSSEMILADVRSFSEKLSGVNAITWEAFNGGPAGKDIEIRISGKNFDDITEVSTRIKREFATFDGVVDLDDNYDIGKKEVQLRLRETARPTGITVSDLGNYVRFALYGAEARRITRNREDVKIMVRFPEEYRADVHNLESLWVPVPAAQTAENTAAMANSDAANAGRNLRDSRWVPLGEVAEFTESQSYTTINRAQQDRSVTIYGDVDTAVTNLTNVMENFRSTTLADIQREYPNVRVEFLGTSEERAKSFGSLKFAFIVAVLLIYMMLAGLFRSYTQPIVVMVAILFGFEGALIGHLITDNPVTILSRIGLVALTGIIVNDSLVLVDFTNKLLRKGYSPFEANVQGAKLRLRAILLTTVTTAAGLTPLMFETSFQAKFLIPMAVTLTYGLIFATGLTLIIVPCINMIYFDFQKLKSDAWAAYRGKSNEDASQFREMNPAETTPAGLPSG